MQKVKATIILEWREYIFNYCFLATQLSAGVGDSKFVDFGGGNNQCCTLWFTAVLGLIIYILNNLLRVGWCDRVTISCFHKVWEHEWFEKSVDDDVS